MSAPLGRTTREAAPQRHGPQTSPPPPPPPRGGGGGGGDCGLQGCLASGGAARPGRGGSGGEGGREGGTATPPEPSKPADLATLTYDRGSGTTAIVDTSWGGRGAGVGRSGDAALYGLSGMRCACAARSGLVWGWRRGGRHERGWGGHRIGVVESVTATGVTDRAVSEGFKRGGKQ